MLYQTFKLSVFFPVYNLEEKKYIPIIFNIFYELIFFLQFYFKNFHIRGKSLIIHYNEEKQ